ncbi:MAG: hypothetical protein PVH61_32025 [Candidatus Aminicenantes bacterium]
MSVRKIAKDLKRFKAAYLTFLIIFAILFVPASPLILRHLPSGKEIRIEKVGDSALDPGSRYIAYSI